MITAKEARETINIDNKANYKRDLPRLEKMADIAVRKALKNKQTKVSVYLDDNHALFDSINNNIDTVCIHFNNYGYKTTYNKTADSDGAGIELFLNW